MSYRDVRLWLTKVGELIVVLGIKRSEIVEASVCGVLCIVPQINVSPDCFVRLCRVNRMVPTIKRSDEFLHGEFRFRGIAIKTSVWSKSEDPDTAQHWTAVNAYSQPMLESKRPAIGVKRTAIGDNRRLIGLPAPKVVDVR